MVTTTVDILRHGECEGGHIFRGSTDVNLSPIGLEQMHGSSAKITEQWDVVVTSPLKRCLVFAEALIGERKLPLDIDDDLREMCFGDWEAQTISRVWQEHSDVVSAWSDDPAAVTPPNGEPLSKVIRRVEAVLERLIDCYKGQHMLIVTHGGVIRVILAHILGILPTKINCFDVPYACMSRFAVYHSDSGDRVKLLFHNV